MKRTNVGDILTMGLLDGSVISTYDNDSTLIVVNRQAFCQRGKKENDSLQTYFDFVLKASRLEDEKQYNAMQPYFLVGGGEISTGLYDTQRNEIRMPCLVCIDDDPDWEYFYSFFKKCLTST